MKKDIVNDTFQKHLKLLHEHLNINEAYGDPAHLDWAMRDQGQRPDWDPDGYTGIRQPSSYRPTRKFDPEEEARENFSNTVAGYARNNGFDVNILIRYLNLIKEKDRNDWKETDPFIGSYAYGSYKFDKNAFKRWAEQDKEESDRDYKNRKEKDKEEAPSSEINSKAFEIKRDMIWLIRSIGTIKWQVFKLKNPKEKLKYLSDYFDKNTVKLTKGHFDRESYEDLEPYFYKYSNNDEKAKLILLAAIKASEKDSNARGFFEQ